MAAEKDANPDFNDVQSMVDQAMAEAQASLDEIRDDAGEGGEDPAATIAAATAPASNLDLLGDVELDVTVELGRTRMLVEDVLRLTDGSVVELDKLAGDPVDVYVNGRHVARGEVLVLSDNFCIRINEIVADLDEEAREAAESASGQVEQEAGSEA